MKKYTGLTCAIAVTALAFLQGCAHGGYREQLDQKLERETTVKSRSDLVNEADHLIQTAQSLSLEQRARLSALLKSMRAESDQLHEKSLRLRSLLVKDLVAKNYNRQEVNSVKSRLKEVEHERLSLFFRGVHQVNEVLGRWELRRKKEDESFYDRIMLETLDF